MKLPLGVVLVVFASACLADDDRGVGGFGGTNSVLRFDLMKGDWLPPYGNGEVADVSMGARVDRSGADRNERREGRASSRPPCT